MKKKLIIIFALLVLISISVFFVYYYNIDIQKFFSVDEMRKYVLSFGILGATAIILICIVAAITTVIPSFLVVFATTAVYGWWVSAISTWTNS